MNRILVWDIPTRLFHWLLAAAFAAAFGIATLTDDDNPTFQLHMLLGLIMVFMVVLRVVWGFVGTRYARFGSFLFGPGAVVEYLKGTLTGRGKRHIGHNPGSSLAIYAILALTAGMAITGVLHSTGGEVVKTLHEVLAYTFAAVVGVHIVGVVVHTFRHRENITWSMLAGRKVGEAAMGIASSQPIAGALFLLLVGAWSWRLVANHDAAAGQVTIPLTGQTIQLGEGAEAQGPEGSKKEHEEGKHGKREHDDD